MRKLTIIIASLFLFLASTYSQAGDGVYQFLSLPPSSHIAALGGTNVSVHDNDLSFSLQNPALLCPDLHNQLSVNVTDYISDITFGSASYAYKLDDYNFLAAGVLFLNYGNFTETTEDNEIIGKFTAKDFAMNLMYGRKLTDRWTIGATLKPIFSSYEQYSSFALGVDLGANYYDKDHFLSGGFVIKNIGRQLKAYYQEGGDQQIESLPFEIQAGITKKLEHAPFRFSLTATNLQHWDMASIDNLTTTSLVGVSQVVNNKLGFGDNLMRHMIVDAEFLPTANFFLTVGYNYRLKKELTVLTNSSSTGFSFGGGLKLSKFQFGFALAQYAVGNLSYSFSIATDLNSFNF